MLTPEEAAPHSDRTTSATFCSTLPGWAAISPASVASALLSAS
jgi:hypothetical protein